MTVTALNPKSKQRLMYVALKLCAVLCFIAMPRNLLRAQTEDPTGTNAIINALGQTSGSGAKVVVKEPDFEEKKLPRQPQKQSTKHEASGELPPLESSADQEAVPIGIVGEQLNAANAATSTGYRIQIYTGNMANSKREALARAAQIEARYPGAGTYVEYQAPFWKVLVGNYRTKTEAQHDTRLLKDAFPSFSREIYVVRSKIFVAR